MPNLPWSPESHRDCPFCKKIVKGDVRMESLMTGVVSFEPLDPVVPGHRLFVSASHHEDVAGAPKVAASCMKAAAEYVKKHKIEANIITSIGPSATQTVKHIHLHVVPRVEGDGLQLPWTGQVKADG
jgi:histidine triad (HIT) family protein